MRGTTPVPFIKRVRSIPRWDLGARQGLAATSRVTSPPAWPCVPTSSETLFPWRSVSRAGELLRTLVFGVVRYAELKTGHETESTAPPPGGSPR